MQQVADWDYYYYVSGSDDVQNLELPFMDYTTTTGHDLEPQGFFRWYNLTTDEKSDNVAAYSSSTKLQEMFFSGDETRSAGLVAYNLGLTSSPKGPTQDIIGVKYTPPTEAKSGDWAGETIACDVSRYIDGLDASGSYFVHEPTLSTRYIYHILPAKKMADDIKTALVKNNSDTDDNSYEDNKKITLGAKDVSSTMTLRLSHEKYWFYPMTGTNKHAYSQDSKYKITDSDFGDEMFQSTSTKWYAYDQTMTKYCILTYSHSSRFYEFKLSMFNGLQWYTLDGATTTSPTITYGSVIFVVAYAVNGSNSCPIANFDIRIFNVYPKTKDELANEPTRLISYLEEHYTQATDPISFDNDNSELTLSAPTSPDDNMSRIPSAWDKRAYGFVYRDLIEQSAGGTSAGAYYNPQHSPLHGDYGLYKSANVLGISGNGTAFTDNYLWYTGGELRDKTYEYTNGAQSGHFLYVDASDESRSIAAADFKSDLCTGSQLVFSAAVAEMTGDNIRPQLMFKIYGMIRDEDDNEVSRTLLHSFSSGNFDNNVTIPLQKATWYQVYGKITLQKEVGADRFMDFRLVIDNYCNGTLGADYAVDDIRLYIKHARIDVLQDEPICDDNASTAEVKLKLRALHETMTALTDHATEGTVYFRFVDEDGNPTTDVDYGNGNYNYGSAVIPDDYSATRTLNNDLSDAETLMFETIDGDNYIVLANRHFNLDLSKQYYVSVTFDDPTSADAEWGTPDMVCSTYSSWFSMIAQDVMITDANGNVVTSVRMPCDESKEANIDINARLVTVDQSTGGSITLQNVKFDWFMGSKSEFQAIPKLQEALADFRANMKDATTLDGYSNVAEDPAYVTVLETYVNNKTLILAASTEFPKDEVTLTAGNTYTISVIPISEKHEEGGVTYQICLDPMEFTLRVVTDGPTLNFGFSDVDYPSTTYYRIVRLGLPQLNKMISENESNNENGYLYLPIHSMTNSSGDVQALSFSGDYNKITLSGTNDPVFTITQIGTVKGETLNNGEETLGILFNSDFVKNLHEGYWYEAAFTYEESDASSNDCPGESYLRFYIVPEYLTWNPRADNNLSANWNNDLNWNRTVKADIYKGSEYSDNNENGTSYANVPNANTYVPMKFSKVTVKDYGERRFPDLGYIQYQNNGIASDLTNVSGHAATSEIQYSIMVKWKSDNTYGMENNNYYCEKFYGNTCDQIYFKPQAELLDQCFLIYNKAWVEKEFEPNKWYAMCSPLKDVYAGDMYVPYSNGRQETEAFTDINFVTSDGYSRNRYPIYQRNWDRQGTEIAASGEYDAYDYSGTSITMPETINLTSTLWSHVYNDMRESYSHIETSDYGVGGFAIKAGNSYFPGTSATGNALVRLPKADTEYSYYDYADNATSGSVTLSKDSIYRMVVDPDYTSTAMCRITLPIENLHQSSEMGGNTYYLIGNPYTATLSMFRFLRNNSHLVNTTVWTLEDGELKANTVPTGTYYDKSKDVMIRPMQAFFVKLNDGAVPKDISFTSSMTIDRYVIGGEDISNTSETQASSIRMKVANDSQSSEARLNVSADALMEYSDDEDAEALYNNLDYTPTLYTVASDKAVELNSLPEIDWLPFGVVSEDEEDFKLTAQGTDSYGEKLYVYDAATKSYTELNDADTLTIKSNAHGRYFLTTSGGTTGNRIADADVNNSVNCYSPQAGLIVATATADDVMNKVMVYGTDGSMVKQVLVDNEISCNINVPRGIYIVKVMTNGNTEPVVRKLSVR
ncbi:MAG: hypothetical protein Q4D41_02830 [Prevotellaceae bacterium]|nr:hypothetical protein [Prevotellaceae bacterium]